MAGSARVGLAGAGRTAVPWAEAVAAWGPATARLRDLQHQPGAPLAASMPPCWATALAAGGVRAACTWACSADGRWVRWQQQQSQRFFLAADDGRLLDPPVAPPPPSEAAAGWTPACVVDSPPPRGRAVGAALPLPPLRSYSATTPSPLTGSTHAPRPTDLYLAGPWAGVLLDPMLWGHGDRSITHFRVQRVTIRLTHLRVLALPSSPYSPSQALRPPLWGPGNAGANAGAVQALAARQCSVVAAKLAAPGQAVAGGSSRRPPPTDEELWSIYRQPWMEPSSPRALPADRAAARAAVAAVPRPRPGTGDDCFDPASAGSDDRRKWREAWRLVHDRGRCRRQRSFHWLLMHAGLPCKAARATSWGAGGRQLAEAVCCSHADSLAALSVPTSAALGSTPETLLHALLECPAVRPAAQWASTGWGRVEAGNGPPLTPSVWLQGDLGSWQPRQAALGPVWAAWRISFLSAVWRLRCRREARGMAFTSAELAAAAVAEMRLVVSVAWARASPIVTGGLEGVSPAWFPLAPRGGAGVGPFEALWCVGGVFAGVQRAAGRPPALEFHLEAPAALVG